MSAFVVSDECIGRIVAALDEATFRTSGPWRLLSGYVPGELKAKIEGDGSDGRDEVGQILRDMNEDAVRARYGEDCEDMIPEAFELPRPCEVGSMPAACKSLDCFLYQCAEGDVPDRPLFGQLGDFRNAIARSIVGEHADYIAAPWG